MKAFLKFAYDTENADQVREIKVIQHAYDWKLVLHEIDEELRKKLKYDPELPDAVYTALQEMRDLLHRELSERNLSLYD
jgi:hypothetical protein